MRLFLEVAGTLRERIADGVYPVGRRLPGRSVLAADLQTSVATVREALSYLVAEGVLEVRSQSGHYPVAHPELGRFTVDLNLIRRDPDRGYLMGAGTGNWPPTSPPAVLSLPCPAPVALMLSEYEGQVEPDVDVVARRRSVGPGYPVQLTTTYLAPWLVDAHPVVGQPDTGPGGWMDRVEEHLGKPIEGRWFATSRPPLPEEARELGLPAQSSTAWVTEARRRLTIDGRPIAAEVVLWDARRVELTGEMSRDTSASWPVDPVPMRNSPGP